MVKGIIMKLKDAGINAYFTEDKVEEIQKQEEQSQLFIYYLDEVVPKTLIYLKDLCMETRRLSVVSMRPKSLPTTWRLRVHLSRRISAMALLPVLLPRVLSKRTATACRMKRNLNNTQIKKLRS